ncbi:uncharacterized protein LOC108412589 [Pygocentrus nattereri]|uniref:uncharacterized protein LOC108412589 n=1 Tax=Pygocentrus nattereri TaxID=42514 RepID=UPI0018910DCD|nr:uncharacterized protein LOC108412589 [Pygocentrus nattereri]
MAKSSSSNSTRRSLKSLFSKSEVNLKESAERDEQSRSRTLRLFTWRRKRRTAGDGQASDTTRVDSPEADEEDWPDADQKPSIYSTGPRSKKGLLSSSETDLHKPKRISSFSLGWRRKKKKNAALSQSFASRDHLPEQQTEDQVDQVEFSQQVQCEVVEPELTPSLIPTDHQHHQNIQPEEVMEGAAGFMPANINSTLISYIDSDSDGYQTPPESPGLVPEEYVFAHTDLDATGQPPTEPSSTIDDEISTEKINFALNAGCSKIPAKGSEESTSAAPIFLSSTSTVTSNISLMKGHHLSSDADRRHHSVTQPHLQKHECYVSEKPVNSAKKTEVASKANSMSTTFSTSGSLHSLLSSSALSPAEEPSSQITDTTAVQIGSSSKTKLADVQSVHNIDIVTALPATSDHRIPTTGCSSHSQQESTDHNTSPGWVSPSLGEVSGDSVPKDESGSALNPQHSPVPPEITEFSSFSLDHHDLEGVSVSADTSLTSTDVTDSVQPILATVEPVCLGSELVQLQDESVSSPLSIHISNLETCTSFGSSNTTGIAPNDDLRMRYTHMDRLEHSRQAPDLAEVAQTEQVSKVSLNTDSISATTDHINIYPDISYHTRTSVTQLQKDRIDAQIYLAADESHEEPQIFIQKHDGNEPVTLGNDFESINSHLHLHNKRRALESGFDNLMKVVSDGCEVQLSSAGDGIVEERASNEAAEVKWEAEEMLGSFHTRINDQRTESHQYAEAQGQSGREREVAAGEVAWQLSDLAIMKPVVPVQRERVPEECTVAHPCGLHEEASITDCNLETRSHLGAGYSPSLTTLSACAITLQEDAARGGASLHTDREDSSIKEQRGTYTHLKPSSGEEDPSETPHGRASRYRPHVFPAHETNDSQDTNKSTVTSSAARRSEDPQHQHRAGDLSLHPGAAANSTADTSRTFTERSTTTAGVIVYIRGFGEKEEYHSTRTSALTDQLPAPRHTSAGRFSHAFPALSTVAEESDPESPVESASGSDTDMSSGVGVLSTTLILKPIGSQEGREDGKKVHKVSLVSSSSSTNGSAHYMSENRLTDVTGSSHESGSVWRTRYEDFGSIREESKPSTVDTSHSDLSGNTYLYSSLSSFRSEPTTYSSPCYSFSSDAPPSSVSVDTTGILGNSSWQNLRSEVQESTENEVSGRRGEEFSAPAGLREVERKRGITNTGSDSLTQQSNDFFSGVFKATWWSCRLLPNRRQPDPDPDPMPSSPHDMDTLLDT